MGAIKLRHILLLMGTTLLLAGCGDDSDKKAEVLIKNYDIVDDYDYDRVKVVVEDELTPEEVAKEILETEMNLNVKKKDTYDEFGISPNNGLFVNAAILEGPEIPSEPGFDKQAAILSKNTNSTDMDYLVTKYDELQKNRQNVLSNHSDNDTLIDITDTINRRISDQAERIQDQKEKKRIQEEIFGVPELVEILPDELD